MTDYLLIKPEPYVPYDAPPAAYRSSTFGNNLQTMQGEKWLSNNYNFLQEIMKFVPRAESTLYVAEDSPVMWDDAQKKYVYNQDVVGKLGLTHGETDLNFYDHEFDSSTGADASNGYFMNGADFGDFTYPDSQRFHSNTIGSSFNNFKWNPGITSFYNTNEDIEVYNKAKSNLREGRFLLSGQESLSGNYQYSNAVDITTNAFPVWTASDSYNGTSNHLDRRAYSYAGFTSAETYLNNFYPEDYNNLFFGLNPSMLRDSNGNVINWSTATGSVADYLPDITDYSSPLADGKSLFQHAQDFFNDPNGDGNTSDAITTQTDYGTNVTEPTFYEIAMDPHAPWGDNTNPWWTSKTPQDQNKAAFYLSILFLESRRRYFGAMTNLFGPSRQFEGANWYNDFYDAKTGDDANSIDQAMQDRFYRWMTDNYGDKATPGTSDWMSADSGEYNKFLLSGIVQEQYRFTQWMSAFSTGDAYYADGDNDKSRISAFRAWMINGLNNYRSTFVSNPSPVDLTPLLYNGLGNQTQVSFITGFSYDLGGVYNQSSLQFSLHLAGTDPSNPANWTTGPLPDGITCSINYPTAGSNTNVIFTVPSAVNSKYDQVKITGKYFNYSIDTASLNALISGLGGMSSYKLQELMSKIPTSCGDFNSAYTLITYLQTEINKVKDGGAYDEFVHELFYNDPAYTAGKYNETAKYELQPRSGDSNGAFKTNTTLDARSWDRTWGNYVTNIGEDLNHDGVYAYNDNINSSTYDGHRGLITGLDGNFWSLVTKQTSAAYMSPSKTFFMDERWDGGVVKDTTPPTWFKDRPYFGNSGATSTFNGLWLSNEGLRLYWGFSSSYTYTTMGVMLINETRKADAKRKEDKYQQGKEEELQDKIDEAKAAAKLEQKLREIEKQFLKPKPKQKQNK